MNSLAVHCPNRLTLIARIITFPFSSSWQFLDFSSMIQGKGRQMEKTSNGPFVIGLLGITTGPASRDLPRYSHRAKELTATLPSGDQDNSLYPPKLLVDNLPPSR
jgi:hypothetical protein